MKVKEIEPMIDDENKEVGSESFVHEGDENMEEERSEVGVQEKKKKPLFPLPVVFGAGIAALLIMLAVLAGQAGLERQLKGAASAQGACYRNSGCSVTTWAYCKANSGPNFRYHWIGGKGCLDEYRFATTVYTDKKCTFDREAVPWRVVCLRSAQNKISCPSGQIESYPGPVRLVYFKRWGINPSGLPPYHCNLTCSVVAQCIPDPSPSLDASKPTVTPKITVKPKVTFVPKVTVTPEEPDQCERLYPDGDQGETDTYGKIDVRGEGALAYMAQVDAWTKAKDVVVDGGWNDAGCQSNYEGEAKEDLNADSVECTLNSISSFDDFIAACGEGVDAEIPNDPGSTLDFECSLCSCSACGESPVPSPS